MTVDSTGRMLTYSGTRSTYKVAVARTPAPPDVDSIATRLAAAERVTGQAQLSVRDTVRATIGAVTFSVDYGRPLARGRTLLGDVISYDRVWRTGANAATQLTTSAPITLAGLSLPAGTYTLWTAPHVRGVDLIVNKQTGQWGTEYRRDQDLGTARMQSDSAGTRRWRSSPSRSRRPTPDTARSRWNGGRSGGRRPSWLSSPAHQGRSPGCRRSQACTYGQVAITRRPCSRAYARAARTRASPTPCP